jgi:hypothetical protein
MLLPFDMAEHHAGYPLEGAILLHLMLLRGQYAEFAADFQQQDRLVPCIVCLPFKATEPRKFSAFSSTK